jgi:hypothetical protein
MTHLGPHCGCYEEAFRHDSDRHLASTPAHDANMAWLVGEVGPESLDFLSFEINESRMHSRKMLWHAKGRPTVTLVARQLEQAGVIVNRRSRIVDRKGLEEFGMRVLRHWPRPN